MADALVSIVLEQLSSIIVREIEQKVRLVVGVEKEIDKLKSNLLAIQAVLVDAEKRQFKDQTVKQWIYKLKSICYDVDDVLDEWSAAILKSEIEGGNEHQSAAVQPKKKVFSLFRAACSCFSWREIGLRHDIACRIQEINEKLNDIASERKKFDFVLVKDTEQIERSMTTSVVDKTEVKGRDQDKNALVRMLLAESSEQPNPHIISLVGMGGIGKTTLAKLVYNDSEVEAHFEKRIWVCVSDPFDETRVAKAILESLLGSTPNLVELQTILERIQGHVGDKKFFLVLDDVWEEDPRKWEQLKHSLSCSSPGSKILVTTRKEIVANMMGCIDIYPLGKLPTNECWSIFSHVAFFGRTRRECERLEDVGRKIVDKCKGLPLAAKTLGGLLRFKNSKEEWQNVLDSEVWELEEAERDLLLAPLRLSYYDLPPILRQCFSYCAIFPKDYQIEKSYLIELWMAQGYLKKTKGKSMSTVGEEYFQNLAVRSFFQDFTINEADDSIQSCKMHDIVHDFAQVLAKDECSSIQVNDIEELRMDSFCSEMRHSVMEFVKEAPFPSSFYQKRKLRSLLIQSRGNLRIEASLPDLFNQMTCLRSLDLHNCRISEIPLAINKLVHLRQLDLSYNGNLKELPATFCELYNLQILDVSYCRRLLLPHGIATLTNLSHLHNFNCDNALPKGIGRLSRLETLDAFIVGHDGEACSLGDLRNLTCLQGQLCKTGWFCLMGMENVTNVDDVKQAQLDKKTQISPLKLLFGEKKAEWRKQHDEGLIEALQPPPNLEGLWIFNFQGTRVFPTWMMQLSNLRTLFLTDCVNPEHLPPLGKLPSLEFLRIWGMYGVEKVGVEFLGIETCEDERSSPEVVFPKLKTLRFVDMKNWEDWVDDFQKDSTMPCLTSLEVWRCPKLKTLPLHLLQKTTLKNLEIYRCSFLENDYQKGGDDWLKISHIPNIMINS